MADIRIKDLATTASTTASDDFMAVDGTTNGTRKLSAATPSFATSVTVPGVAGPTATDLTLAGGSTGASLVLGQGASAASSTITNTGTGSLSVVNGDYFNVLTLSRNSSATNTGTTIVFRSKDAGGTYVDVGAMFAAKSVATIGAVDSFLTWSTRRAGTLTDAMTLTATGNLVIGPTTSETGLTGAGGLKINSTTAGASNAGALVVAGGISAAGASYFGGAVTVEKSLNSDLSNFIINTNAGTGAEANLYVSNAGTGATSATLGVMGTGYATVGGFIQDAGVVSSGTGLSGGLSIMARAASSDIRFYAGSHTNLVATFASTGAATFAGAVTVTGALKLGNAYVGTPVVSTGYITIQDNTGTTYKVAVSL